MPGQSDWPGMSTGGRFGALAFGQGRGVFDMARDA
ncbi:hypothetical protein BAV0349 [Bordetella avium 197N]|uniref:Uncharacterized protein n=1 Tax=Bordetella avium (strain 197N) TaxID=360910 RepID=Q2KZK2_BORA1|nr:hypothetical protein BAV0349 [Bordetella avium 197N]SUV70200.1 Uncharacterised protein [Bordetella avium]